MSKKLLTIIEGACVIALGVLIAVFGGVQTLSTYFGVLFIIAGAGLLAFDVALLCRTKLLNFGLTFLGGATLALGIGLLLHNDLFAVVVYVIMLFAIAGGCALVAYGIWSIVRKLVFTGIGQIVIGAALATLASVYLKVPSFQEIFWIIAGVLVAVYGLLVLLGALFSKEAK